MIYIVSLVLISHMHNQSLAHLTQVKPERAKHRQEIETFRHLSYNVGGKQRRGQSTSILLRKLRIPRGLPSQRKQASPKTWKNMLKSLQNDEARLAHTASLRRFRNSCCSILLLHVCVLGLLQFVPFDALIRLLDCLEKPCSYSRRCSQAESKVRVHR